MCQGSSVALQMEIFDAYVEDLIRQDKAKEKKGKGGTSQEEERKKPLQSDLQSDDVTRVARAAKVMERMVNQNTFDDIAQGVSFLTSQLDVGSPSFTHACAQQISSIMRMLVMSTERARENCCLYGDSSMTRPRKQALQLYAGTLSIETSLLWDMAHVS